MKNVEMKIEINDSARIDKLINYLYKLIQEKTKLWIFELFIFVDKITVCVEPKLKLIFYHIYYNKGKGFCRY